MRHSVVTWGDWIAFGAAGVATVSLVWQVLTWRRSRRSVVRVSHFVQAKWPMGVHLEPEFIVVRATNLSDHTVRVLEISLRVRKTLYGRGEWEEEWRSKTESDPGDEMPGRIQPHDSAVCRFPIDSIEPMPDLSKPPHLREHFRASVVLASGGKPFLSKEGPLELDRLGNLPL